MFHFKRKMSKIGLALAILTSIFNWIENASAASAPVESSQAVVPPKKTVPIKYWTVSLGFISWQEKLNLTNSTTTDWGTSNLTGNSLNVDYESYFAKHLHHGMLASASLLYGVVTATGNGGVLLYNLANVNWSGVAVSYRYLYRFTEKIAVSIGPLVVERNLSYPSTPTGISANSGATLNYGGLMDFRARVFEHVELSQSIGTLLSQGGTVWQLALGYAF